jgi:signal transduction histidine kinase/CheY-like chemotaxis protein
VPIRTQLIILVLAVIAPVAVLAAMATLGLWDLQRDVYQQRFLERASGLRIALDTELDSTLRQLRDLSDDIDLDDTFGGQAQRLLSNHPSWSMIGVVRPNGEVVARADRRPALAAAKFDPARFDEDATSPGALISDLVEVPAEPGTFVTYLAMRIVRGGEVLGAIYIGIESAAWLDFFRRYPSDHGATLTVNDRAGRIIVRTLHNELWAGRTSTEDYLSQTIGRDEGAMIVAGVDDKGYYAAFSRSRLSGWTIGTGVPQDELDAALRRPTYIMLFGVFAAAALATLFAYTLGGRITGALTTLARSVASLTSGERRLPQEPLPIGEAETVRRALIDGAELLAARERSLNDALAAEARSRGAAEFASRTKDDLLAMLGHELRNPLNAMKAAVSVLDMPNARPEVDERAREVVRRQIGHLTSIIDDLLDVARLDSGKAQLRNVTLALDALVRRVVRTFEDTGRSDGHAVAVELAPVWVVGDETRLEQVVSNLFDNACKYTPRGGRISIRVFAEGNDAVLRMSDSGSGIAPDVLPRIFDLFTQGERTLDRSQGGLGLGLTVVRRLVHLHGGSIQANSDGLDRGATFTVRLPSVSAPSVAEPRDALPRPKPIDVVVVEDNPDNRHLVGEMLRMRGHRVTETGDGISGVKAILAGRTDLAIVDIGLPGCDGYEVARRVRASSSGQAVRLVALTGYGRAEDRARALAAGFDLFLVKPFDIDALEAGWRQLEGAPDDAVADRSATG